jgi:hypothetical protein
MKDWTGCRGLEPAIALLVQNAMPPYLIGADTTAIVPFSATKLSRETNVLAREPTTFEFLTEHLGQFVKLARETGVTLTDELLQREARCIVYGDDDPWNQTAADNPQWLNLFKQGHSIMPTNDQPQDWAILNQAGTELNTPWTIEDWMNPTVQNTMLDRTAGFGQCTAAVMPDHINLMPYAWQSPECLAEFRERNISEQARGSLGMGTNSLPNGTASLSAETVLGSFQCFGQGRRDTSSLSGRVSNTDLLIGHSGTHIAEASAECIFTDGNMLQLGTDADHGISAEMQCFDNVQPDADIFIAAAFE